MKTFKQLISEGRVEVPGKQTEWEKSILRDYSKAEFTNHKPSGDVHAHVRKVLVGEFLTKKKKGYKYDKPNVKG